MSEAEQAEALIRIEKMAEEQLQNHFKYLSNYD